MSAFDSLTTRMPNGLTNASQYQTMGAAGIPDPTWSQLFAEDFITYHADDWTVTATGTGAASLVPFDGGAINIVTDAGPTDSVYMQLAAANFAAVPGKLLFFKFAGQVSSALQANILVGLLNETVTPLAAAEGIAIHKIPTTNQLTLNVYNGSAITSYNLPEQFLLEDDVPFELGFMLDYQGNVAVFFNPTTGSQQPQNQPDVPVGRVLSIFGITFPTGLLTPTIAVVNTDAAANTLTADFIVASRER